MLLDGEERLGAGRVYHENIYSTEDDRHLTDQTDNLDLATHVRLECMGVAAGLQNALAELFSCVTAIKVIDGNVRADCSLLESNRGADHVKRR